ncbi:MAG: hypothetical protein U0S76_12370, partial [Pseudoxanthomonas sp.]|nr:hypothetical protein [Pseudoxanthomonas sp.]
EHVDMGHMRGPDNTVAMMAGKGPFGNLEMGGMFTVIKVRDDLARDDFRDPGWYRHPEGTVAWRVSADPDFGQPERRGAAPRDRHDPALPRASREQHRDHKH